MNETSKGIGVPTFIEHHIFVSKFTNKISKKFVIFEKIKEKLLNNLMMFETIIVTFIRLKIILFPPKRVGLKDY